MTLSPHVERASAVAGLGADAGLDQPVHDGAATVVDGRVQPGDEAASDTRGGAPGADALADVGGRCPGHVDGSDGPGVRYGRVGVPDDAEVVAGEAGCGGGSDDGVHGGTGVPGGGAVGAVTGRDDVVRGSAAYVDTRRAAPAVGVNGVAARQEGAQPAVEPFEGHGTGETPGGLAESGEFGVRDRGVGDDPQLPGALVDGPGRPVDPQGLDGRSRARRRRGRHSGSRPWARPSRWCRTPRGLPRRAGSVLRRAVVSV